MKLISQSFEILNPKTEEEILKSIEMAGRTCYKSHDKISDNSCEKFVKNIISRGHESVLEHDSIQLKIITDRGVLAEFTRHRIGVAFSVESTRYCNYGDKEIEFIDPRCGRYDKLTETILDENGDPKNKFLTHIKAYNDAERYYKLLIKQGATPQEARQVLPQALKVEMIVTANIREWRHILKLRTSPQAHPHCKDLFGKILDEFQKIYPVLFGDLTINPCWSA